MSKRHYFHSLQNYQDMESQNLNKYILNLENKVEEKNHSPIIGNLFFIPEKQKNSKQAYLEDLKKQIDLKHLKKQQEILDKITPGISENYHGYPNLPQTPREIRRKRELSQMNELRKELSEQIALKSQKISVLKSLERESEKTSNQLDYQKYIDDKKNKEIKKETEKEALTSAWNQAKKARELQYALETADRLGVRPTISSSLRNIEFSKAKNTEDESSQINAEVDSKAIESPTETSNRAVKPLKKVGIKEKAKKIKEKLEILEKNSYQHKIRELVKGAKKQRKDLKPYKKSTSPGYQNTGAGNSNIFVSHKAFKPIFS